LAGQIVVVPDRGWQVQAAQFATGDHDPAIDDRQVHAAWRAEQDPGPGLPRHPA